MARHVDVVRRNGRARHRRAAEARVALHAELLASAVAGLAGPVLHAGLPGLVHQERRAHLVQRRRRRRVT